MMVTHEKSWPIAETALLPSRTGVCWTMCCWAKTKAENRRRLFGDVTSGDIAEPETTVEEEKAGSQAGKRPWLLPWLKK
ncbi:MAG: hypothetical protein ACLRZH_08420 [Ruthenibacterium lactatiformans]